MMRRVFAGEVCLCVLAAAILPLMAADSNGHKVRATGVIRAVHSVLVQVPRVEGQGGQLTLATLIENGSVVHEGDSLAAFDRTNQIRLLREAQAKFDDLSHQVEQKQAEHNSNVEKRTSDLLGAEADLKKAEIEIRKGPVLSEIERQKNQVKLQDAQEHVASLKRSSEFHNQAETAEIRILELQRDRQQVAVEREQTNMEKLAVKASLNGMVAWSTR